MQDAQGAVAPPQSISEGSAGGRVCDQCRLRKTRCDKEQPCYNCRTTKRSCTFTGAGQRPKEPGQRVHISTQYEKKIDRIEARLARIEGLLSGGSRAVLPQDGNSGAPCWPYNPTPVTDPDIENGNTELTTTTDSGFTSHTTYTSEFIKRTIDTGSLHHISPKLENALANLSRLVETHKGQRITRSPRFPLQQSIPPGGIVHLAMPPAMAVFGLLRPAGSPPNIFSVLCGIVGISDFTSLCNTVYSRTSRVSSATFTIVNALLYNLFTEQHSVATEPTAREQYRTYLTMCRANLETALATMPFFLPLSTESAQFLVLGAIYAIDISRPFIASQLITMAASLCQKGGFHRSELLQFDLPQTSRLKRLLFWNVYMMDKDLSLRLGQGSSINDSDITIPREFEYYGFGHGDSSAIPTFWIKLSSVQGRIYEHLYSPAALASSQPQLLERATLLAAECRELEEELSTIQHQIYPYLESIGASDLVNAIKGDEIQLQVALTLIYRIIPNPQGSVSQFCVECLNASRKAMNLHQDCARLMAVGKFDERIYAHWNLLATPFAPFFVLLCYVVETRSLDDLKILHDFVSSLELARESSEPIDKLHRLCQAMYAVVMVYVEAKSQPLQNQNLIPIGNTFELYMNELGLMPAEFPALAYTNNTGSYMGNTSQASQIADWFAASQNMISLIDDDIPWTSSGNLNISDESNSPL